MDNYSRAILASAATRKQDLSAFLSVLYRAVEKHGAPKTLVTDSGSVFLSNRAKAVYAKLGVSKEEIEKGRPWQNFSETTFGIQQRMADWHFQKAESWPELVAAHDAWVRDYNAQVHWAHREREDGRSSPTEVLGWLTGLRYRKDDLERAFFSTRYSRVLDSLGYARIRDWRLYGEEGLAKREAAVWLQPGSLTVEFAGETLSRYDVEVAAQTGEMRSVGRPWLFENSRVLPQLRLFALDEAGWIKALRLEAYAPRAPRRPRALQQVLFAYAEAP